MSAARTKSTARHRVAGLHDSPINVVANQRPATIEVSSNLAEDTIIASGLDVGSDRSKVALFGNPFSGREELLYIDENRTLRWAHHANPPSLQPHPDELDGWSNDPIVEDARQVVVVVHPDGDLYCFVLVPYGRPGEGQLGLYRLEIDESVPGGQAWRELYLMGGQVPLEGTTLSVQYCNDRLRTPIVFTCIPGQAALHWCVAIYEHDLDDNEVPFKTVGYAAYDLDAVGAPVMAGADSCDLAFDRGYQLSVVRVWTLRGTQLHLTTVFPRNGTKVESTLPGQWEQLISIWSHPLGAGVVVARDTGDGQTELGYVVAAPGVDNVLSTTIHSVTKLDDIEAWQDGDGLLHIYGRGADDTLQVLHQVGWSTDQIEPMWGLMVPLFEPYVRDPAEKVTVRPLLPGVGFFAVDAYPDQMASQFVRHQDVEAGEGCALLTQSVTTTLWATEKIRVVPDTLPKPYAVSRYETTLTVKDGYGASVAGCELHLTSDAPVDLEVAGRFYRTGTTTPIVLTTDLRGKVTLRTLATGLYVPQMHITAPGLGQSVSLQQAADLHAFLGGTGNLPNHPEGFTAGVVDKARNPADPTKPLFPNLNRGAAADATWPPTPQDVVTWCQGAFAVDAGTVLPALMVDGLGEGEKVRAFTLQTHDPSRPGFEVYTDAEGLGLRRESLQAQGFLTELTDWLGDLWEGIKQGVTTVYEVLIDLENGLIEVCIEFADGVKAFFTTIWDSLVSAAQAVESVFVAIGAKIDEAIAWLRWVFDFDDIWATKTALDGGVAYFKPALTQTLTMMKDIADGWFQLQEEHVRDAFEQMKVAVGNRPVAGLSSPALPDDRNPPTSALVQDRVDDPHLSWFYEHLVRSGATSPGAGLPTPVGATADPFTTLIDAIVASPGWKSLGLALEDLESLVTNLFDISDPQTFAAEELNSILDLFENLIVGLLELGDTAVDALVTFVESMLDLIDGLLSTPVESDLVEAVYRYVQEQAGVAPDKIARPTIGGLATLVAAFPTTILCKIVIGRPPFAGGKLPAIPYDGTPLEEADTHDYPGGQLIKPPAWDSVMAWQIFQGLMMAVDGPFDVVLDASAYFPEDDPDKPWFATLTTTESRIFAGLHFICYGVGDCPWIWGNTFPPHPHVDATWLAPMSWAGSAIVNLVDVGCSFKNGYLLARFDEDKTGVGPFTLTGFGVARIIISALRYKYVGSQSSTDLLNLMINVTSFESSASGVLRFLFQRNPGLEYLMNLKILLDLVCDLFAGITTTYQTMYSETNPPVIAFDGDALPPATVNEPYSFQFTASGGWTPYTWDDAGVALPPGLSIDASTGQLSGTPTQPGTYSLRVQLTDYSGPSFTFLTDPRTLTVS